jgi:hypothetical protein
MENGSLARNLFRPLSASRYIASRGVAEMTRSYVYPLCWKPISSMSNIDLLMWSRWMWKTDAFDSTRYFSKGRPPVTSREDATLSTHTRHETYETCADGKRRTGPPSPFPVVRGRSSKHHLYVYRGSVKGRRPGLSGGATSSPCAKTCSGCKVESGAHLHPPPCCAPVRGNAVYCKQW